jgi:O-antigen/teichoic acid export membrane protein
MYDSRYHAASWMVPVLAIGLWHTLMYATTQPALYCRGRSNYQAIGNICYCIATVSSILLAFHFWGIFGAVVAVAAGDLPMYVVMVIAASREGVSTWRQDVLTTAIFLVFLGLGQVARISILGWLGFPHWNLGRSGGAFLGQTFRPVFSWIYFCG